MLDFFVVFIIIIFCLILENLFGLRMSGNDDEGTTAVREGNRNEVKPIKYPKMYKIHLARKHTV